MSDKVQFPGTLQPEKEISPATHPNIQEDVRAANMEHPPVSNIHPHPSTDVNETDMGVTGKAFEFVKEKAVEAKDFLEEKAGEIKEKVTRTKSNESIQPLQKPEDVYKETTTTTTGTTASTLNPNPVESNKDSPHSVTDYLGEKMAGIREYFGEWTGKNKNIEKDLSPVVTPKQDDINRDTGVKDFSGIRDYVGDHISAKSVFHPKAEDVNTTSTGPTINPVTRKLVESKGPTKSVAGFLGDKIAGIREYFGELAGRHKGEANKPDVKFNETTPKTEDVKMESTESSKTKLPSVSAQQEVTINEPQQEYYKQQSTPNQQQTDRWGKWEGSRGVKPHKKYEASPEYIVEKAPSESKHTEMPHTKELSYQEKHLK